MQYLLDTDTIINHLRGKTSLESNWIKKGASISVITLGELQTGALKSSKPKKNTRLIAAFLTDNRIEVIPVTPEIVKHYAQLRSQLENRGQRLDDFDLLIASTALERNLRLISYNQRHFSRLTKMGLKLLKT